MIKALIFALAVALAPPFPWTTYDDVPTPTFIGRLCDGTVVAGRISPEWVVATTTTRDLFIHYTDGNLDFMFFTEGTVSGRKIVVRKVLSLDEALKAYPDPCSWFTETLL